MPLIRVKDAPDATSMSQNTDIFSQIQRRRYQILVHSLLYYELDTHLISDTQWSQWAAELVELQRAYPDIADKVIFADAFKSFDGSTGFHLPYTDEQIVNIAYRLLRASSNEDARSRLAEFCRISTTKAQYEGFNAKSTATSKIQSNRKEVKKVESTKRKKLF